MSNQIRVRFAPSPTGYLHVGGARTALFNYLYTRRHGGRFILRIEDTDRTRSTDEYIESILEAIHWLGLDYDEGPFRQTDRAHIYNAFVKKLLEEGKAYYCYCSPEELELKRKAAMALGKTPKYDGTCRNLTTPPPCASIPTVRFKMSEKGETVVNDLIKGHVAFDNSTLDDFIIVRSDGTPTYNFVVVIDDIDMGITHVIRGDDHLNNTPKQIQIYNALGKQAPQFAHLPMILGSDKGRLSKRHGATSVQSYRDMGYLPDALLNYLVRLGWSHGDQEVFTIEQLKNVFSLETVGKSNAVFNPEKLLWLNGEYIRNSAAASLVPLIKPFLQEDGININGTDDAFLAKAVKTLQERSKTLKELAANLHFYLTQDVEINEKAAKKFLTAQNRQYLEKAAEHLATVEHWNEETLERLFTSLMEQLSVDLGKIAQPLRVAITGTSASPGIFEVLAILGRDKTLRRINKALECCA